MRTQTRVGLGLGVILAIAIPASAAAHRPAVAAEKDAMVYHASGRYYGGVCVSEPVSVPSRCFTADISTVARGAQWGAYTFSRYADQSSHAQLCRTGNGVVIEHKIAGRWYVLWEGSDGYPPTRDTRSGSFTLKAVPRRVAKDLIAGLR